MSEQWYARRVVVDGFITHVVSLDDEPVEDEYHYGRNIAKDLSGDHARLIASAPDLLAALQNLLAACQAADAAEELPEQVDGSLLDAAEAAIEKAGQP